MKKTGLYIYCAVLTVALLIVAAAALVSEDWLDTTFKSVSDITMTVNEKDYVFPLAEHTAVKYRTSDSSYVLVSKGNLHFIENFYVGKKYETEASDGRLTVNIDGMSYSIEMFADDMDYVMYLVEAVH